MSNLLKAFDIEKEENSTVNDYEIFKDKEYLESLRKEILEKIIDSGNENFEDNDFINSIIESVIEGKNLNSLERGYLFNLIEGELNEYGPITLLMNDDNVTEIMVNAPDVIYVEVGGKLIKDETVSFINNDHIIRTIEKIIEPLGKTIDATNPLVDARLRDGSRFNAIIPPLSVKGPVMTIRKFKKGVSSLEDLLRIGSVTPYMANFLDTAVRAKLNILISGGTGTGKTTLLNILSASIPEDERIITIESAAELNLKQPHVISLETRENNYEKTGEIKVRDLVRNSLRMRPDRIVVGEVRGEEAFDMLQAMNTGHDGSLTTIHANTTKDALNKLESMILMAHMDLPVSILREYIESTIDLIVHVERHSDGKRKVVCISEIKGIYDGALELQDIFAFNVKGLTPNGEIDGEFVRYDYMPKCMEKIHKKGINDIDYIFE